MKTDKFAGAFRGKGLWMGAALLVVLISASLLFLFFRPPQGPVPATEGKPAARPPSAAVEVVKPAEPPRTEGPAAEALLEKPPAPPVTLDQSDEWVRGKMQGLSSHPGFQEWLKIDHLIRILTVVAANIAEGRSPKPHLGFLDFRAPFLAEDLGSRIVLDPTSYRRYDGITEILSSIDAPAAARLFREFLPLFQEAYRNLGYPNRKVEPVFIAAVNMVLRTPLVEGDIELKHAEKGLNYLFVDDRLEGLNRAQKHFVRMGPRNTAILQEKLRQFSLALGTPRDQLPKRIRYRPGTNRP